MRHFRAIVLDLLPTSAVAAPPTAKDHATNKCECSGRGVAHSRPVAETQGRLVFVISRWRRKRGVARLCIASARVLVLPRAVHHRPHHGAVRRGVAAQLVRDQPARREALIGEQFPKETPGRLLITARLDEDDDDVAVLVDGAP